MASRLSDERVFSMDKLKHALLECTICMESTGTDANFKLKLLDCHHSVCNKCLFQLTDGQSRFKCPECRGAMMVPSGGIDNIQNNFIAEKIKEFAESCNPVRDASAPRSFFKLVKCGGCRSQIDKADRQCVYCGYLCRTCTWTHRDDKSLRHHTIFIPERPESAKMEVRIKFCPTHDLCRLDFYCKTCGIAVCKMCKEFHHTSPSHRVHDVKDFALRCLGEMDCLLGTVLTRRSQATGVLHQIQEEEERLKTETNEMKTKLKAFIQECHIILAKREMELIGAVDHRVQQTLKCLTYSKEHLHDLTSKIGSSLEFVDQIKRNEDPVSVIQAVKGLKPALMEIIDTEIGRKMTSEGSMRYVAPDDLTLDVAAFQHIVSRLGSSFGKYCCHFPDFSFS